MIDPDPKISKLNGILVLHLLLFVCAYSEQSQNCFDIKTSIAFMEIHIILLVGVAG